MLRLFFGKVTGRNIAFNNVSNSGYQSPSASYSWSHTCTGDNRFLAVDIEILSVPGTTVSGITYGGVALSFIGAKSTVSGAGRVESWGLVAPATGSNTIALTLSASVASAGTAVSYSGVNQFVPTESFNSAQATNVGAADATVTVTPVADNCWIHGACATDDTSITANQTTRNNVSGALGSGANEDIGPISPAAATAVSYTGVGALATWAIAGYAIRPVTASGDDESSSSTSSLSSSSSSTSTLSSSSTSTLSSSSTSTLSSSSSSSSTSTLSSSSTSTLSSSSTSTLSSSSSSSSTSTLSSSSTSTLSSSSSSTSSSASTLSSSTSSLSSLSSSSSTASSSSSSTSTLSSSSSSSSSTLSSSSSSLSSLSSSSSSSSSSFSSSSGEIVFVNLATGAKTGLSSASGHSLQSHATSRASRPPV